MPVLHKARLSNPFTMDLAYYCLTFKDQVFPRCRSLEYFLMTHLIGKPVLDMIEIHDPRATWRAW